MLSTLNMKHKTLMQVDLVFGYNSMSFTSKVYALCLKTHSFLVNKWHHLLFTLL